LIQRQQNKTEWAKQYPVQDSFFRGATTRLGNARSPEAEKHYPDNQWDRIVVHRIVVGAAPAITASMIPMTIPMMMIASIQPTYSWMDSAAIATLSIGSSGCRTV
jgi:hypothetical protein